MNKRHVRHFYSPRPHSLTAIVSAILLCALTACADTIEETSNDEAGGAGGDEMNPMESANTSSGGDPGIRLLTPFVGTYDITGTWNGTPDDEALLVIRAPSDSGESEVLIYDALPDRGNCYSTLPPGVAKQEPVGERIFLDRILQFDDAILSLSGSTLIIDYFDTFDFDRDGDTAELIRYRASPVAVMEEDIQPICP